MKHFSEIKIFPKAGRSVAGVSASVITTIITIITP